MRIYSCSGMMLSFLNVIFFVLASLHFGMLQPFTESVDGDGHQMPVVPLPVRRHEDRVIRRYRPFSTVWSGETHSVPVTDVVPFVSGETPLDDTRVKSCFLPHECVESSVNFGISRIVIPIKCCHSDRCNDHDAPGNADLSHYFRVDCFRDRFRGE